MDQSSKLSRRERQIMNVIYARKEATAAEVVAGVADPPSRTAIRTLLGILVEKGLLKYTKRGREYVYFSTDSPKKVGRSAFKNLLDTFFCGSVEDALTSHLSDPQSHIDDEELKRLEKIIRDARKEKHK